MYVSERERGRERDQTRKLDLNSTISKNSLQPIPYSKQNILTTNNYSIPSHNQTVFIQHSSPIFIAILLYSICNLYRNPKYLSEKFVRRNIKQMYFVIFAEVFFSIFERCLFLESRRTWKINTTNIRWYRGARFCIFTHDDVFPVILCLYVFF